MKRSTKVLIGIYVLSALLYALFYFWRGFTDFYVEYLFRPISGLWARVSGLFPFSLAEWTIALFVAFVGAGLLVSLIWLVIKKGKRWKAFYYYGKTIAWVLGVALLMCTMNWFSLYRATEMADKHLISSDRSVEAWVDLFDYVSLELERLEPQLQRDTEGFFELRSDLSKAPQQAMAKLGGTFPEFKGYYPRVKPIHFSFFLSQTGTVGIYLPLYVEANYNKHIVDAQIPFTMCHELSHLKGVIKENEANFFGMMACINSGDPDLMYSGYINILCYLYDDEPDENQLKPYKEKYDKATKRITDEVYRELWRYYPDNYWEEHEEEVIIPTDVVEKVDHVVYDTTLQLNGVEDGIVSYQRVTNCLLDYFAEHKDLKVK